MTINNMHPKLISAIIALTVSGSFGQGAFIYDQQSSTDETPFPYGTGGSLQGSSPGAGQSLTPGLSGVNFIKFMLIDGNPTDGLGTTTYVNLRSGSMLGSILATSAPLATPDGFHGPATFLFPTEVQVRPGNSYYFEIVPQSGGPMNIFGTSYNYAGGTAFANASPSPGSDLWFREGILVPEPTSTALTLVGATIFLFRRRAQRP